MKISRHYTTPNQDPYAEIEFRRSKSEIRNPDGSMVFSLDEVEVPSNWSQVATDILEELLEEEEAGLFAPISSEKDASANV
jgi:ribonucleoside-diphosphate reductase alpha chain